MWVAIGVYLLIAPFNEYERASFTIHDNGVTILCDNSNIGDTGVVNGITYTKRRANQISVDNAATTCTSGIDDFSYLFEGKIKFNEDISHWDVSDAYTFEAMFRNARSFNQDISNWDMSNAIFTSSMFEMALSFNQNIGQWNVFSLCFANDMFLGARSFNQNLNDWDTRSFIDIGRMFNNATSFNSDLSNWKIKNVIYLNEFLLGSSISPDHYTKLLKSWSKQEPKSGLELNVNGISYLPDAKEARDKLITDYSWEIYGDYLQLDNFDEAAVNPYDNQSITNVTIPFSWKHITYSSHYKLQLSDDVNFSTTILDTLIYNSNEFTFTLNQEDISDILYWRIQALSIENDKVNGQSNWLTRSLNAKALANFEEPTFNKRTIEIKSYPNPFNPKTTISFRLSTHSNIQLGIYNAYGQLISHLVNGKILSQGIHQYSWDATGYASGVYFIHLISNEEVHVLPISLIK
jgi:surface protein